MKKYGDRSDLLELPLRNEQGTIATLLAECGIRELEAVHWAPAMPIDHDFVSLRGLDRQGEPVQGTAVVEGEDEADIERAARQACSMLGCFVCKKALGEI